MLMSEMKCKIDGCNNPVWPSIAKGLCNKHYQREKHGVMNPDGTLKPRLRVKTCESCGTTFQLGQKQNHIKWCDDCRSEEYSKIQAENNAGIYRRGKNLSPESLERQRMQRYFSQVADWLDVRCEKLVKYLPMIEMHKQGETAESLGRKFGMSGQNVRQIVQDYSC